MSYTCPLCHAPLSRSENSYICPQRHQFDLAKEGYVNLLPVQFKRSRDPGDSAEMMQARRAFLDGGYYQPLREAICSYLRLSRRASCWISAAERDTTRMLSPPLPHAVSASTSQNRRSAPPLNVTRRSNSALLPANGCLLPIGLWMRWCVFMRPVTRTN